MFKRIVSLVLATVISVSLIGGAAAEGKKSFWDSLGSFVESVLNEDTGWASDLLEEAKTWVGDNWGEASEWVSKAWGESSDWVTSIWGDASEWAAENLPGATEALSEWLTGVFEEVTGKTGNVWSWIGTASKTFDTKGKKLLDDVRSVITDTEGKTEEKVRSVFESILNEFDLAREDVERVWETVKAYAKEKGLAFVKLAKMMLPYLLQLKEEQTREGNTSVPAVLISQYLTGIMEKLGVDSEETAQSLLDQLEEMLNGL